MKLKIKDKYIDARITNPFGKSGLVALRFLDHKDYEKYYKVVPQFFDVVQPVKKEPKAKNENTGQE